MNRWITSGLRRVPDATAVSAPLRRKHAGDAIHSHIKGKQREGTADGTDEPSPVQGILPANL